MTDTIRRLLSLNRHAMAPGPLCKTCLDREIREELASLAHAQDIDALESRK